MQPHAALGVGVFGDDELLADGRSNTKLFHQLTGETRLMRFVRLALATRKLPQSAEMRVIEPSGDEDPASALDDRRQDDDHGRGDTHDIRNGRGGLAARRLRALAVSLANVRHCLEIVHTSQRGLRAEQTVAPKSISA